MPSIKTSIYDGSVCVNQSGVLDLRGETAVQLNFSARAGNTSFAVDTASGEVPDHLNVGDEIFTENREILGVIEKITTNIITLRQPLSINYSNDKYIYTYPKFEVAAIVCLEREDGGGGTDEPLFYDTELSPIKSGWASTAKVGTSSWQATADTDFGAYDAGSGVGLGSTMLLEILPGETIYGRWEYVKMGAVKNNSVLCYLKATPTRGKQRSLYP
tara:strand:+ start:510 stop:1157 length:648 start_codon:yes stop_codon:yes gene_type:complete